MTSKSLVERWDLLLTIVSAALAIILLLLNILPPSAVLPLLLTYMGIFAFNQLRENVNREEYLKRLEQLYGTHFKYRTLNQHDYYILLQNAIVSAKSSVLFTHIEATPPQMSGIKVKHEYFKAKDQIVKAKWEVTFREIYILPDEPIARSRKLEWVRLQLSTYKACPHFNARIYDQAKQKLIVLPLSLQIIDGSQMLMLEMKREQHTSSESIEAFWTNDPEVVKHFERYYEVFWSSCSIIKEGTLIEWNNLST